MVVPRKVINHPLIWDAHCIVEQAFCVGYTRSLSADIANVYNLIAPGSPSDKLLSRFFRLVIGTHNIDVGGTSLGIIMFSYV